MGSRARRTTFNDWWWTVDRLTLAALAALMLGGIVLCLAASPPVAARIGLDPFHFVDRQVLFLIPAAGVLFATSFLSPREVRQISLIVFFVSLVLVAATPYFGAEIKGARRWLVILGVNIQPSEFLKPAFVILIAWLFGEIGQAAGNAGEFFGAGPAHRRGVAARGAARLRPDHADLRWSGARSSTWRGCALSGSSGSPPRRVLAC